MNGQPNPAVEPAAQLAAELAAPAALGIYGVVGHPIRHSLSPLLHNTAFQAYGLPGAYTAWDVPPPRLEDFVGAVRLLGIAGVSVTIPHKERIAGLVEETDDLARRVGAANTLVRRGDGTLFATNTDVFGFTAPLRKLELRLDTPVLLLGAGGAARAAAVGLVDLGFTDITVTSRSGESGARLAGEFSLRTVAWEKRLAAPAGLVVNVTPLGMAGKDPDATPYPLARLREGSGVVYDTVYTPYTTRLLGEAAAAGWRTVPGLAMFISQGAEQFRLWTGRNLPNLSTMAIAKKLYGAAGAQEIAEVSRDNP